jgi:hypothetical protein
MCVAAMFLAALSDGDSGKEGVGKRSSPGLNKLNEKCLLIITSSIFKVTRKRISNRKHLSKKLFT